MKPEGIRKAALRLAGARQRLERLKQLESGIDFPSFEKEWSSFLSDLNSAPEILKTTARKAGGRFAPWFGRKEREIKRDPVLMFLKQARGTDYHGLESGTAPHVTGAEFLGYSRPDFYFLIEATDGSGRRGVIGGNALMLQGDVRSYTFQIKLKEVTDKNNVTFMPPRDKAGGEVRPTAAAQIAVIHYETLLDEATKLASAGNA